MKLFERSWGLSSVALSGSWVLRGGLDGVVTCSCSGFAVQEFPETKGYLILGSL